MRCIDFETLLKNQHEACVEKSAQNGMAALSIEGL